jgi:histone H3/H4
VQHLFLAYRILYDIHEECRKEPDAPEWSPKTLRELGERLTDEAHLCAEHGLRVDIRTAKDSELAKAVRVANRFFLNYEVRFRRYLESDLLDQEKPPEPPDDEAFQAILAFQEEIRAFVGVVAPPGPELRPSETKTLA